MNEQRKTLQERLDQKYKEYLEQLQEKPAPELIELAPEITAAMQIYRDLASSCSEDDLDFLLQLDNPLELMAGHWREEMDGDHSEERSHMVWNVRDRGLYEEEDLRPTPRMEML